MAAAISMLPAGVVAPAAEAEVRPLPPPAPDVPPPWPAAAAPPAAAAAAAGPPAVPAASSPGGAPSVAAAPSAWTGAALQAECVLQLGLSLPISATYLLSFAMMVTSQIFVGHLSAEALAAASLATIFGNATGMAVLIGLSSASETLSSQAYGAGNLPRVGAVAQRACALLLAVCLPVAAAWLALGPVLRALGQDPVTVELAESYLRLQLLGLPAIALYEVLKRTLQSVSVAAPQVVIGCAAVACNAALGAFLIFCTPLGFMGAPIALAASQVLMLVLALAYIRSHRRVHARLRAVQRAWLRMVGGGGRGGAGGSAGAGGAAAAAAESQTAGLAAAADLPVVDERPLDGSEATAGSAVVAVASAQPASLAAPPDLDDVLDAVFSLPLSTEHALTGWGEYLQLGVPSALLLVLEWGSFEVATLIAGTISVKTLAAHTVIASTAALSFMPPLGISIAAGIRIGQLCGDLEARRAKLACLAAMVLNGAFIVANTCFILSAGATWGYVFTDDAEVVELVAQAIWMLALYSLFDSYQCIGAGGLRGLGLPSYGAAANLIGWVCVGLPLAWVFAIREGLGLRGIWVGFTAAVAVVSLLCFAVLLLKDWQAIAVASHSRAMQGLPPKSDAATTAAAAADAGAGEAAAPIVAPALTSPPGLAIPGSPGSSAGRASAGP